jgi:hypothetical protein
VVISDEWPVSFAHAKRIVIQDTTELDPLRTPSCYPTGEDIENGKWAPALADFKRQNAQSWRFLRRFSLGLPYQLERKDDLEAFFKARGLAGWDDFNAVHPETNGFIILSGVGFDRDRKKAIVYMSHYCGVVCGAGTYLFLELRTGRWTEVKTNLQTCGWVS